MTPESDEFIRRFPIRQQYQTLGLPADRESIRRCPRCGKGEMVRILTLAPAGLPPDS
jgi:hypothetical protein